LSDERRTGARFITELSVVLRPSKGGPPIDDRATAHDVSVKGFKVETQAQLPENTQLSFTLELPMGEHASGKGRVVWSNRETFATWAGVQITAMSWGDKRRLNQLTDPDRTDWANLFNLCFKLAMAITVIVAAHRIILSGQLRGLVASLAPKIVALFVMGWALVGLFKKERR
jgi:hypothetical protein